MTSDSGGLRRFNPSFPCPICDGHERLPRGHGIRCAGFLSSNGRYAHCSREEYAHGLELENKSRTYAHRLNGSCRCGVSHGGVNGADVSPSSSRRIVSTYNYTDESRRLLYQVVRYEPKDFRQRRRNGAGGWEWKLGDTRRVLYRLPELLAGLAAGDPVYVVEGEKDADRLHAAGQVATCNSEGAGKWRPEHSETLRDAADVRVVADRDGKESRPPFAGYLHAISVAAGLRSVGASTRVFESPVEKDVSDLLDAGGSLEALVEIDPEERLRSLTESTSEAKTESAATPEEPDRARIIVTGATEPLGDAATLDALANAAELRAPNSVDSVDAWEDPVDFGADEYGPAVPLEAFPEPLARYTESLAASHQVAPDLVAGAVLGMAAAAAAAAAGRAGVAIGDTHVEPLNLYVMPVASPGERKRVIRETTFPLEEEECRLREAAAPVIAEAKIQRGIAEKRIKHLEDLAAKSKKDAEREQAKWEAVKLSRELPLVPPEPRLLLDDATPEYVAKALAEQQGCIAIVSEEAGTLFEVMCGKYRDGVADLDVYLKAYDGGTIRVGRISRESVLVAHPALSILVTPQPAVLDRLAERSELRGRGLLGRIAFILPPSRVGTRMYHNVAIDKAAKAAYGRALQRILHLRPKEGEPPGPLLLRGEALGIWAQYADAMERDQADGGRLAGIQDWASKHAGRVARIAGIFHLLDDRSWPDPFSVPITTETVAAAWVVGEWLCDHALVAFSRMGADPKVTLAKRILGWIRRDRPEQLTLRDLHQHFRQVDLPTDLLPALEVLEGRGFIRRRAEEASRGRGRKPSPTFDVNLRTRTHITQKSTGNGQPGVSV